MRRVISICVLLALLLAVTGSVSAATGATVVQSFATVSTDGGCQVSIAMTLHLEQAGEKLYFPVPADATGISVNGSRVAATKDGDVKNINLSRVVGNVVGDFSVNIQYSLHDVIHLSEEGVLQLQVPVLCGFSYPVEKLEFSVTLPGQIPVLPSFSSGYHQAAIEEHLTCTVDGAVAKVQSLKAMKDHETLTMTMAVSEEMFPQSIVKTQSVDSAYIGMVICGVLAVVYWLLTLRSLPWRRKRNSQPPHGFTAGQLGGIAYMQGVDLTMSIFTWAQLGYVLIQRDRYGNVSVQRRMEMGNERSEAERRLFTKLFGKKDVVDTRSFHYASLQRTAAKRPAMVQELMHRRTGNTKVFRALAATMGVFAGAGIGLRMGSGAVLAGFLVVLMGALGGISGWFMTLWTVGLQLRCKYKLHRAAALAAVWLLLGLMAGEGILALWFIVSMIPAGILYAWAGRRTALGRQTVSQVLGLKRYLRHPNKEQLRLQVESDPNYFFEMVPYALALGEDMEFARSFAGMKPENCSYITGVNGENLSAVQWCELLRKITAAMDRRARQMPMEKLLGLIHGMTKR